MSTAQQLIGSINESSGDSTIYQHPQHSGKRPIEETTCGNSELAIERAEVKRELVEEAETINNVCKGYEENRDNQSKDNVEEQLKIDPENDEDITLRDSKTASGGNKNKSDDLQPKDIVSEETLQGSSFLKKASLEDIKPEPGYIIYLVLNLLTRFSKFKLFGLIERSKIPFGIPEQKRDGFYMVMTCSEDTDHLSLLILVDGGKIKEFYDPRGMPALLEAFKEEFAAINEIEIQSCESNTCSYHCIVYMALRLCNKMKDIIEAFPSRKSNSELEENDHPSRKSNSELEENDHLVISIGEKLVREVKENEHVKVFATNEKICDETSVDKLYEIIKDAPKIMGAVEEFNKGIIEFSIKNHLQYSE